MHILILTDEGGRTAHLTTLSPASRNGMPVLQFSAHDIDSAFGPTDMIPDPEKPSGIVAAAKIVVNWAVKPGRTEEEIKAARLFLLQWPEGPQI